MSPDVFAGEQLTQSFSVLLFFWTKLTQYCSLPWVPGPQPQTHITTLARRNPHQCTNTPESREIRLRVPNPVPDICAVDEISVCWLGLQRQLAEWKGSLDTVSPPQRGLSFYLLHFPALYFLLKSPSIVHFSLKKCSYKMSYFHSGLNNATVEKKFYMLSFVKFNFSVK